jgi:siroheme synthase
VTPCSRKSRQSTKIVPVGERLRRPLDDAGRNQRGACRESRQCGLVVRLKGGDPGVFGRLGEEMDRTTPRMALLRSCVPGVTAATAAGADAAFPLTASRVRPPPSRSSSAGHCADGTEQDWQGAYRDRRDALSLYRGEGADRPSP